jgi:DNA-directed RNA polymerase specialized sigma24 family protein
MATLRERQLLDQLRLRDEAAFNRIVALYTDAVLEHVRSRIADPSVTADLVQNIFVRAFRDAEHAPRASGLFLWLCAIADEHIGDAPLTAARLSGGE